MKRRDFCAGAVSSLLFSELLALKFTGLANEAFAAVGSTPLKNYICFWTGGAERCWFDGVLNPNGSTDSLGAGPGVFNYLNVGAGNKYENRTTSQKINGKFHLPHLWGCNLPTLDGSVVPMTSLAANTAIMRGSHTGLTFDAHAQNAEKMQIPFPGLSILGSVADNSSNILIPAIVSGGRFTSHTNKSASTTNSQLNAYDIFKSLELKSSKNSPYSRSASAVMGRKKFDTIVSSFIQSISSQLPARSGKTMEVMMDNRVQALQLMDRGFDGISADYLAAFERYQTIIKHVMNPTSNRLYDGLDSNPVVGNGLRVRMNDKISMTYSSNFDVIDGFATARCDNMADAFAKSEVYLKYDITNCMHFDISGISLISDEYSRNDGQRPTFDFDCHFTGDLLRGVAWSRFYQSFAACMLLFKNQIGSTKWSNTLTNLRSEFNRGYSHDRGTDHAISSCVESFFSGSITTGPIVVGNVTAAGSSTTGDGAPIDELSGQIPDSKHTFSTVGNLMGYEPSRNHGALLGFVNGSVASLVSPPKNIK